MTFETILKLASKNSTFRKEIIRSLQSFDDDISETSSLDGDDIDHLEDQKSETLKEVYSHLNGIFEEMSSELEDIENELPGILSSKETQKVFEVIKGLEVLSQMMKIRLRGR